MIGDGNETGTSQYTPQETTTRAPRRREPGRKYGTAYTPRWPRFLLSLEACRHDGSTDITHRSRASRAPRRYATRAHERPGRTHAHTRGRPATHREQAMQIGVATSEAKQTTGQQHHRVIFSHSRRKGEEKGGKPSSEAKRATHAEPPNEWLSSHTGEPRVQSAVGLRGLSRARTRNPASVRRAKTGTWETRHVRLMRFRHWVRTERDRRVARRARRLRLGAPAFFLVDGPIYYTESPPLLQKQEDKECSLACLLVCRHSVSIGG